MILKVRRDTRLENVYFNTTYENSDTTEIIFKLNFHNEYLEHNFTEYANEFNSKYGLLNNKKTIFTIVSNIVDVRTFKFYLHFLMFGIKKVNILFCELNSYNFDNYQNIVDLDADDDEIVKIAAAIRIQKQFRAMKYNGYFDNNDFDEFDYILNI